MTPAHSSSGMKYDWWLLGLVTYCAYSPSDLTCPWKLNTHTDPTTERKYSISVGMWAGKGKVFSFLFRGCSSLHCICMGMSMTHQALSVDRKLSLAAPLVKQRDRKSGKEKKERKKERMCPHECDIVLLDCFAHHDNHEDGGRGAGDPLAFQPGDNTERYCRLNLSDIPVVSGSNPWISMNWLIAPCSGPQKCPAHIRSSRCPFWPLLTCFQPLAAFRPETMIPQG